ncbi:MAG: PAS domain-containing protein, partial [Bacteroidota bacterium]
MKDLEFEKFESSFNEFPVILLALSESKELIYANNFVKSVINFAKNSRDENSSVLNLLFPSKKQQEFLNEFLETSKNSLIDIPEVEILNKKGELLLVNWKIKQRDTTLFPEFKYWLIGQDTTPAFLIKKKLIESESKFNFISRATNDAIYEWDLIIDELKWHEGIKNIFGHEEENIENNINWWKLHLHPDDALKVELSLGAAISSDKDFWIEEYKFLTNDGKYASVLDRAYIIRNENGKAIKMIGGMQDISDLKKIEQKLLEKNRKLSEIAFFNSHKLRAPLARIIGLVSTFDLEEEIFSETTK